MRTIGSQMRETLAESGYTLVKRPMPREVVLADKGRYGLPIITIAAMWYKLAAGVMNSSGDTSPLRY